MRTVGWVLTPRATVAAAAAVVTALVSAGCNAPHDVATADPPSPGPAGTAAPVDDAPTDPATPALATVRGERVPAAHWVDATGLLTHRTVEVGPSDTVLPAAHAVGDWLDRHLDDLQRGGDGHLDEVAAAGLLTTATADDLAAVTTDLASPATPVASATYRLDGAYAEATEWVTATVEVTDTAGDRHAATLVFVPTDAGPELVLFGPATPGGAA